MPDRLQLQRLAGVIFWNAQRPIDRGETTRVGKRFVGISPDGIVWAARNPAEFRQYCREFDRRYRGYTVQDDGYSCPEWDRPGDDYPFVRPRYRPVGQRGYPDAPRYEAHKPPVVEAVPTSADVQRAEYAADGDHRECNQYTGVYLRPHPTVQGRWCRLYRLGEAAVRRGGVIGYWYLGSGVPEFHRITCNVCGTPGATVANRRHQVFTCATCAERACADCGGPGRLVSSGSGRRYCSECANSNGFYTCNICLSADVNRHEHCGCGQRRERSDAGPCGCGRYSIRGYSDRTANLLPPLGIPDKPAGIRSKRGVTWFGVELEQECTGDASMSAGHTIRAVGADYAVAKSDSSVHNGFELVTARATLAAHSERLGRPDVFRGCRDNGPSAGMHVHVSRNALTPLQLGKMLVLVNSPANDAFIRDVAGRVSTYAARMRKRITDSVKYANSRYEALNLTNTHTVEFRIFASSTEPSTILGRLEFVDAVIAYCATASIRALDWTRFRDWVGSQPRKRWPHFGAWFEAYRPGHTLSGLPILGVGSDDDDSDDDDE